MYWYVPVRIMAVPEAGRAEVPERLALDHRGRPRRNPKECQGRRQGPETGHGPRRFHTRLRDPLSPAGRRGQGRSRLKFWRLTAAAGSMAGAYCWVGPGEV